MGKQHIGASPNEKFDMLIKSEKMLCDLKTKTKADIKKGNGKFSLRILEALTKVNKTQLQQLADWVLGPPSHLTILRNVKVGGIETNSLLSQISKDFDVTNSFQGFIDGSRLCGEHRFINPAQEEKVSFAIGRAVDFGFTGEIFSEWLSFLRNHPRYALCEIADGAYLRMAYVDQPIGTKVICAMRLFNPYWVFTLEYKETDNRERLDLQHFVQNSNLSHDDVWVIRIRK